MMSHHHPPTRMSHFVCEQNMFAKWIKSTVQHMFKRSIQIHIHIYLYIKLVVSTQLKCILVKLDHFRKCLNPPPKQCIPLKIHVFSTKSSYSHLEVWNQRWGPHQPVAIPTSPIRASQKFTETEPPDKSIFPPGQPTRGNQTEYTAGK